MIRSGTDGWVALPAAAGLAIALAATQESVGPYPVLLAAMVAWAGLGARGRTTGPEALPPPPGGAGRVGPGEVLLVAGLVVLCYLPPVLARYGPFGEDKYLLSAALRALDGQQPYSGFEFLYGPLVLVPAVAWFRAFGYSLEAYYWLLALVEAATAALLLAGLGRLVPGRRERLGLFALAALLLVNDNLGLSWVALRRLVPVAALVVWAWGGESRRGWWLTAALVALEVVVSLELAAAMLVGLGGIGIAGSLAERTARPLARVVGAGTAGVTLGLLAAAGMLGGSGVVEWLRATWAVIAARGGGEAGFPLEVTGSTVAVLMVLTLGVGRLARGLARPGPAELGPGDRLLAGGVAYALVAMKSGFGRADMYHMVPPVLGILAASWLPLTAIRFPMTAPARRAMAVATVLLVLTWTPGLLGAGRLWAEGLVLGARDIVTRHPPDAAVPRQPRGPHLLHGRSHNPVEMVALADFLGEPRRAGAPVVYYGPAWGLARMIGAPPPAGVHATDDYLVSDAAGRAIADFLRQRADALVVIDRADWLFLRDGTEPPPARNMFWIGGSYSAPVRLLERWSSAHFGAAVVDEIAHKQARWARTVGPALAAAYRRVAEFGRWVVLERQA